MTYISNSLNFRNVGHFINYFLLINQFKLCEYREIEINVFFLFKLKVYNAIQLLLSTYKAFK